MAKASDVKTGNVLRFNGELVTVEEFIHRTPGNLRAFYRKVGRVSFSYR
jgi:elongation factor P